MKNGAFLLPLGGHARQMMLATHRHRASYRQTPKGRKGVSEHSFRHEVAQRFSTFVRLSGTRDAPSERHRTGPPAARRCAERGEPLLGARRREEGAAGAGARAEHVVPAPAPGNNLSEPAWPEVTLPKMELDFQAHERRLSLRNAPSGPGRSRSRGSSHCEVPGRHLAPRCPSPSSVLNFKQPKRLKKIR